MRKETRGRQSAASRAVIIADDGDVLERPKPLAELSNEEADEWVTICNAVPATYFSPATWNMVAQYCRHVVVARHLAELIRRETGKRKGFEVTYYRQLLKEQRAESAAIAGLLRAMRLTHLASYAFQRAPIPEATPKPWLS